MKTMNDTKTTIILRTETIGNEEVHYTVERQGDVLWSRIVEFGHDLGHRAGGQAFREAARAQEAFAKRLQ